MDIHRYSGYTLLGLLIFRIYWGVVGSSTARFAQFVRGPRAVLAYVRGTQPEPTPGHNPLGAWSVVAMLVLLLTQVVVGLFVTDIDGLESGPLSHLVSFDASRLLAEIHEAVFNVLLVLIALHVAAVLFYLTVRRANLVAAMVTGRSATVSKEPMTRASFWRAVPGIVLAGLAVWVVARS